MTKNYDIQVDITNHSDHVTNIIRMVTTNVSIKIISIIDTQPLMFKTPLEKAFLACHCPIVLLKCSSYCTTTPIFSL